jgi:hypothetical protein
MDKEDKSYRLQSVSSMTTTKLRWFEYFDFKLEQFKPRLTQTQLLSNGNEFVCSGKWRK